MLMSAAEWEQFCRMVAEMIPTVNTHQAPGSEIRTGAWACARNRAEGDATMYHTPIGEMEPDSSEKRQVASRVKVRMLCENPGVETSWEMRDPDHGRWGGGVSVVQMDDVSISGFPEDFDTAGVVYALGRLDRISRYDAYRIAGKAGTAAHCLKILEQTHGSLPDER